MADGFYQRVNAQWLNAIPENLLDQVNERARIAIEEQVRPIAPGQMYVNLHTTGNVTAPQWRLLGNTRTNNEPITFRAEDFRSTEWQHEQIANTITREAKALRPDCCCGDSGDPNWDHSTEDGCSWKDVEPPVTRPNTPPRAGLETPHIFLDEIRQLRIP